ncbi:MAG TPA: hypothetical protein VMG10_12095 [Gemmataceae bacterium]|nr:hypothetical protein [Gemmataceae bacterium]
MGPTIIWDLEDDEDGNWWHIVVEGHGITADEVEEVLRSHHAESVISYTSGNPITFGWTSQDRYIAVIYHLISDDPLTFRPITAFEATPPR